MQAGRVLCALIGLALASDRAAAVTESDEAEELRTVLFSGIEIGRSAHAGSGFKWRIDGPIDTPGTFIFGSFGSGTGRERDEAGRLDHDRARLTSFGSFGLGHSWFVGPTVFSIALGPEVDHEQVVRGNAKFDRDALQFGVRIVGEIWSHPSPDTLLTFTIVAGSARGHVWARLAGGYRVHERVFVGPELAVYRDQTFEEIRLGLHATGLELVGYTLRLSGGWRFETSNRHNGP
ncbi:MAG TPA: cellulose biosynthesis protein BcsS [Beijerinckiaceae bacterium]